MTDPSPGIHYPRFREIQMPNDEPVFEATVPHYPPFESRAAAIQGLIVNRGASTTWHFPLARKEEAIALGHMHFGEPGRLVRCRLAAPQNGTEMWALGRRIVALIGSDVVLGRGVSIVWGAFIRGHGALRAWPETVLEVADVPATLGKNEAAASDGKVDVVGDTDSQMLGCVATRFYRLANSMTHLPLPARWTGETFTLDDGSAWVSVWPGRIVVTTPDGTAETFARTEAKQAALCLFRHGLNRRINDILAVWDQHD